MTQAIALAVVLGVVGGLRAHGFSSATTRALQRHPDSASEHLLLLSALARRYPPAVASRSNWQKGWLT